MFIVWCFLFVVLSKRSVKLFVETPQFKAGIYYKLSINQLLIFGVQANTAAMIIFGGPSEWQPGGLRTLVLIPLWYAF